LDEALQRVKLYYDRELPARVRRLLSLLNPALVVILGAVILVVGLAIILPIMNIYRSLGR
jgi:general secretion pathway protein F